MASLVVLLLFLHLELVVLRLLEVKVATANDLYLGVKLVIYRFGLWIRISQVLVFVLEVVDAAVVRWQALLGSLHRALMRFVHCLIDGFEMWLALTAQLEVAGSHIYNYN